MLSVGFVLSLLFANHSFFSLLNPEFMFKLKPLEYLHLVIEHEGNKITTILNEKINFSQLN
jgi:hypothetical protein